MNKNSKPSKAHIIQLIATGEQKNIDLGVYLWISQKFDKTELVNEFIQRQEFNNCTGWEIYDINIGGLVFGAYVSDYFSLDTEVMKKNPERDFLFYKFYLAGGNLEMDEYVNVKYADEYAKYYIRRLIDYLEYLMVNEKHPCKPFRA